MLFDPIDDYFTAVRLVITAEYLKQRAFSRAIFTEQRNYPPAVGSETDVIERQNSWKRLCNSGKFDKTGNDLTSPALHYGATVNSRVITPQPVARQMRTWSNIYLVS